MNLNQQIEQWLTGNKQSFSFPDRPMVTLSYAQSWDGSITTNAGETLPLSGHESSRLTHHLRCMHDGILVGIGTVLTDDPRLTVRHWDGPDPQPVILDSQLRIPASARLCQRGGKRCWVLTSREAGERDTDTLDIMTLPDDKQGRVDLPAALRALKARGIDSLMVEGGATVISSFLQARLADAVVLTVVPTLVGGYKAVEGLGFTCTSQLPRISPHYHAPLGNDLILWGTLQYGGEPA